MNDESEEFIQLFGGEEIFYVEGARTTTGFYTTEKPPHVTRLENLFLKQILEIITFSP